MKNDINYSGYLLYLQKSIGVITSYDSTSCIFLRISQQIEILQRILSDEIFREQTFFPFGISQKQIKLIYEKLNNLKEKFNNENNKNIQKKD